MCSDDSNCYSDVSAGEISVFTDFDDELCWSDMDDDLTNLEQNDVVSTCVTTEPLVSSTEPAHVQPPVNAIGYAIIGDNIDKNVRPLYQRQDQTTQSLHYFHSYAVKNRIDISEMSDKHLSSIDISPNKILPGQSDIDKMIGECESYFQGMHWYTYMVIV